MIDYDWQFLSVSMKNFDLFDSTNWINHYSEEQVSPKNPVKI